MLERRQYQLDRVARSLIPKLATPVKTPKAKLIHDEDRAVRLQLPNLRAAMPQEWRGLRLRFTDLTSNMAIIVDGCSSWDLREASGSRSLVVTGNHGKTQTLKIGADASITVTQLAPEPQREPCRQLAQADFGYSVITKAGKQGNAIRAWLNSQIGNSFIITTNQGEQIVSKLKKVNPEGDNVKLQHAEGETLISLKQGDQFFVAGNSITKD